MNRYRQLTSGERYALSALRKQGCNQAAIARALGRHRSTISREGATQLEGSSGPGLSTGPGRWLRSVETRQIAPQRALRCMRVANGRDLTR